MSKAHRGKPLRQEMSMGGRDQCPVCKRTGIKVHYEHSASEQTIKVCKQCKAALTHGNKKIVA